MALTALVVLVVLVALPEVLLSRLSRPSRTRVLAHPRVRAAVVAALLAPLAACSSSGPSDTSVTKAKPSPDDRPVTVTVTPAGAKAPAA